MHGEDPRDFGLGPQWEDEPLESRSKVDEEEDWQHTRPRITLFGENPDEA